MFGLSSLAWKFIGYGVIALVILGVGARIKYQWDLGGKYIAAAHAQKAQAKEVKAALTIINKASTKSETTAQAAIQVRYRTIIQKVPVYVTPAQDARTCITWGLVRLHDAAVFGVDPATLDLPAGASDDACSDVTASSFASAVAGNYGLANANAEQLNGLQADIAKRVAATAPKE